MSDKKDIRNRREEALASYKERASQIQDWISERGKPQIRVNPFVTNVSAETVQALADAVEKTLASESTPDSYALNRLLPHLRQYDPVTASTDEAGYDSPDFSLAISEVDTALRHLARNPGNAMKYLAYRYRLKAQANKFVLQDFVPVLHLESSLVCNLMCEMCYQADGDLQGDIKNTPEKMMPWDVFTKIIDEASANECRAVVFAGRGEPTLNPRFSKMLRYCHDKGILDIKLNTNAMTLTEKMVREWLSMNAFLTIVFSVDAGDKAVFEKIRIGSDFNRIVKNIEMFNRIRRDFPNSPVRTRVNMTIFKPEQNVEQARALWGPLVDEFSARNANSEQAGSVYQKNPDGTPRNRNVEPGKICVALYTRMYVWSNGDMNPCESDYRNEMHVWSNGDMNRSRLRLGNVRQDTLRGAWLGEAMTKLRAFHMAGNKNCVYPCNNCTAK